MPAMLANISDWLANIAGLPYSEGCQSLMDSSANMMATLANIWAMTVNNWETWANNGKRRCNLDFRPYMME